MLDDSQGIGAGSNGGVEDGDVGVCKRERLVESSPKKLSSEPHLAPDDFDGVK